MFYILTRDDCSWCDKAKALLDERGATYLAHNYKEHPMLLTLMKHGNLRTVPQIWFDTPAGKEFIGGYTDLVEFFESQDNHDEDWIE